MALDLSNVELSGSPCSLLLADESVDRTCKVRDASTDARLMPVTGASVTLSSSFVEAAVAGLPPTVRAASTATVSSLRRHLPGPLAILYDAICTDGMCGLRLGQAGMLIRETGGSAVWFVTKELVCKPLLRCSDRHGHGDAHAPMYMLPALGER